MRGAGRLLAAGFEPPRQVLPHSVTRSSELMSISISGLSSLPTLGMFSWMILTTRSFDSVSLKVNWALGELMFF